MSSSLGGALLADVGLGALDPVSGHEIGGLDHEAHSEISSLPR